MNQIKTPEPKNNSQTLVATDLTPEKFLQVYGIAQHQAQLVKNTIAKNTTMDEFFMFLTQAKMTGLNPFKNQCRPVIRMAKRGNSTERVMTFQTGIDGYRAIAHRSKVFAGIDAVEYDTIEGQHPEFAKVTVYKVVQGLRVSFSAIAFWHEYLPKIESMRFMWNKMPKHMLAKVAEALALRKAFPEDLSGVFIDEEMSVAMGTEIKADFEEVPKVDKPTNPDLKKAKPKAEKSKEDDKKEEKAETKKASELDPLTMDKTQLSEWLKKQSGKRYNKDIYEKTKEDTFGNTPYKDITLEAFQKFYEALEANAKKG